jgi:3-hexulose-6-phosphate synthase
MKLQIAFDFNDLEKALHVCNQVQEYADIIEVGSLLIYQYGIEAVVRFRSTFPHKTVLADAKISDRGKEAATLFAQAGADWVTIMAGTSRPVVRAASNATHEAGKKVMLDLMDASSLGQSALEAKSMGVDALLFHKPVDDDAQLTFLDRWDMVRQNTQLPVFVSAAITRESIHEILAINPSGVVIGKSITHADNPREEAAHFRGLIPK